MSRIAGACTPMPAHERDAAEHGREAVAGRRRGDADDDAREEAQRSLAQTLLPRPTSLRLRSHAPSPASSSRDPRRRSGASMRPVRRPACRPRRRPRASRSTGAPRPGSSSGGAAARRLRPAAAGGGLAPTARTPCAAARGRAAAPRARRAATSGASSSTTPPSASIASRAWSRSACSGLASPMRIAAWFASITAVCASRSRGRMRSSSCASARACRRRPDRRSCRAVVVDVVIVVVLVRGRDVVSCPCQPRAVSCASAASTDSRVTRT